MKSDASLSPPKTGCPLSPSLPMMLLPSGPSTHCYSPGPHTTSSFMGIFLVGPSGFEDDCVMSPIQCIRWSFFFFLLLLFFFFSLGAAPEAYGSSQARGWIGAAAAGLYHSHSNVRSWLRLRPIPQLGHHQILNPLSEAKDKIRIFMDPSWLGLLTTKPPRELQMKLSKWNTISCLLLYSGGWAYY